MKAGARQGNFWKLLTALAKGRSQSFRCRIAGGRAWRGSRSPPACAHSARLTRRSGNCRPRKPGGKPIWEGTRGLDWVRGGRQAPGRKKTEGLTANTEGLDRGGATRRLELKHAAEHTSPGRRAHAECRGKTEQVSTGFGNAGLPAPGEK